VDDNTYEADVGSFVKN